MQTARDLGFRAVSTNDHLISARPWLDAPTALAAVLAHSGDMAVGTSVALAVVRGPVQMAKTLAAIDILSNGRLFVGVGPGSSARDYEIVGLDYQERWKRFDEAIHVLRSLWSDDGAGFTGRFTRRRESISNPSRCRNQVRRYGSAAGVPTLVYGASRALAMAGSRPHTTRCRINLSWAWRNSATI